ncbi:MAG: glycosyltransferase family 2 protein [Pirellulales bacterium]
MLIPAHNEETVLAATLESVQSQCRPGDRMLVVADNCTDRTSDVARRAGAIVVERHDLQRRGKGFALDWGVRRLETEPPEVVIVVDADCVLAPGSLDAPCANVPPPASRCRPGIS